MSAQNRLWTGLVAVLLAILGFLAGGTGAAWWLRDIRSAPWRDLRVEYEGTKGVTSRTRVVFDNPKVPLLSAELVRGPNGEPELARVEVRGGDELTARYDADRRPVSIEASDGAVARFVYQGENARVSFFSGDGKLLGEKSLRMPVEIRSQLASLASAGRDVLAWLADGSLIADAHAQESDVQVTVKREISLALELTDASPKPSNGSARIEVSCAPLACTPLTPEITMPGKRNVRIGVSAATNKSALAAPAGKSALEAFEKLAAKEAATANEALSHVATVIATVALTADACAALSLAMPVCVPALTRGSTSGAALNGIRSHDVPTSGRALEPRAMELHYQEQARAKLDKPARIEICVARDGYTRACTTLDGRPLAATPMAEVHKSMSLRRGISGTLSGSFVMTQSDGADCKFSPSPRTSGALTLSFDDKTGVVSGTLSASERGARNGLRCSLGSGDMRWSQSYSARMSQTFDKQRLQAGGALTLRLVGTMTGSGQSTQSNCRSSGGASVGCPAGRSESYNYPIELSGSIDLDTQIGTGRLQISNAPLSTSGTWRVPGEKKATP